MRKLVTLVISIVVLFVLVKVVLGALNLGFEIKLSKPTYYPNETIPLNVTIINRELTFSANNLNLTLFVGKRTYSFDLGNLKAGQSITKSLVLPEQPAGSYLVRGVLTYTGYFGETTALENYNNIEVKFPELKRLPRNIYISNFSLPENIEQGKSYEATVIVTNNDTITGDLAIIVESLGSNATKEVKLEPTQTEAVKLNITFLNAGLSTAEARVYGLVDDVKYLLNYLSKSIFVKEVKQAKLFFDKVELYDESDNEINQNDDVKIKIYIKNIGEAPAYNVKGILSSNEPSVITKKSVIDYKLILNKESLSAEAFEIKTSNTPIGTYNLNLDISFSDSAGNHLINFIVPLEVNKELCSNDNQCTSNEICSSGICTKLTCGEDSYPQDHKCKKYECVKDSDCKQQYYTCDTKLHICKSPQCTSDLQCANNEVCSTEGKCKKAFSILVIPLGLNEEDKDKYTKYSRDELAFFRDISPLKEVETTKKPLRIHYIDPKICNPETKCNYNSIDACASEINSCAKKSGLVSSVNKIVALTDNNIGACGFAFLGGFWSVNRIGCQATIPHEMGHQLDLYHVKCRGNEASACEGPNADDCSDPDFKTDVMSYCSPETHYGPSAFKYMKGKYFSTVMSEERE